MARSRWRSKARSGVNNVIFFGAGFFGLMLTVLLFRWFLVTEFDFQNDPFFKPYSDGSGLYYFDVLEWAKSAATSTNYIKDSIVVVFRNFGENAFTDNWFTNIINVILLPINFVFGLLKILLYIPFSLLGLVFGGWFYDWTNPGGWLYQMLSFEIPYLNPANLDWDLSWMNWNQGTPNI